jgi:hypothetical protein
MPGRPPKEWFDRCVEDVAGGGHTVNPAAICGATWRDKSPADKAVAIAMERQPMAAKRRSKKKATAKKPKKPTKPRTKAHRSAHRSAHSKPQHHHRCPACGHMDRHDAKAGCEHFDGKRFCPCRHRHR